MMAALPDTAPATPKKPRRVLVLAKAAGFVHASIPLAARTIEALGQRTGAWTTVISYDPAVITAENLQQFDAIFLASTTGTYLDESGQRGVTAARRKAFMDFIRSGKGLGVIHAGTDSYHGNAPGAAPAPAPPAGGRPRAGRRRAAVARVQQDDQRLLQVALELPDADRGQGRGPGQPDQRGRSRRSTRRPACACRRAAFSVVDEVYTFNETSYVRVAGAHPHQHRLREDAGRGEGAGAGAAAHRSRLRAQLHPAAKGRAACSSRCSATTNRSTSRRRCSAHILAGMQYALGDLEADDKPVGGGAGADVGRALASRTARCAPAVASAARSTRAGETRLARLAGSHAAAALTATSRSGTATSTGTSRAPPRTRCRSTATATREAAPAPIATTASVSSHDAPDDRPRRRAQREADGDLRGPLRHAVVDDRVDADRRQHQQQRPEHQEHPRRHAPQHQVAGDVLGQRPHVEHRQARIEGRDARGGWRRRRRPRCRAARGRASRPRRAARSRYEYRTSGVGGSPKASDVVVRATPTIT